MNLLVLVVDDEPDVEMLFRQQFRHDLRRSSVELDRGAINVQICALCSIKGQARERKRRCGFLAVGRPLGEGGAGNGFLVRQRGPSSFAIFDTFDDEAGRDAHLHGKVATALMEKVKKGDLFADTPEIYKLEILADKAPGPYNSISSRRAGRLRVCRISSTGETSLACSIYERIRKPNRERLHQCSNRGVV